MVEDTIHKYMADDHIEVTLVARNQNYSITQPLKYTESMVMAELLIQKLGPEFVEIWNDASGWNCNLVIDKITYNSKNEENACRAIAKAGYNYIRSVEHGQSIDDNLSSDFDLSSITTDLPN